MTSLATYPSETYHWIIEITHAFFECILSSQKWTHFAGVLRFIYEPQMTLYAL